MAGDLFFYELSNEADNDLDEIYDYTAREFGDAQTIKYLMSFENVFENHCAHTSLGRKRDEISSSNAL